MELVIKSKYKHTFCLQIGQYDAILQGEVTKVTITSEDGTRVKGTLEGSQLMKAWRDAEMSWAKSWPYWIAEIKP